MHLIPHIINLAKHKQVGEAPFLEPLQLVEPRHMEPLQDVRRADVLQQSLLAAVLDVADPVLVGRRQQRQPVLPELPLLDRPVDEAQQRRA